MRKSVPYPLWIIIAVGFVLLLLSSFIEYGGSPDFVKGWLLKNTTYVSLLKEVGFAFIIAYIIAISIERHAKNKQDYDLQKKMREIDRNVFNAVFGVLVPKPVVEHTLNQILNKTVVRRDHVGHYYVELKKFLRTDGTYVDGVLLKSEISFKVENVTNAKQTYPLEVEVEKPSLANLKDPGPLVQIQDVFINQKRRDDVKSADRQAPDTKGFKRFLWEEELEAGQVLEVRFVLSVIRGQDDSEFWYTLVPSDGMTLQLSVPKGFRSFGAVSIHPDTLIETQKQPGSGFYEWQLRGTTLPYQGILLWWRYSEASPEIRASDDADTKTPPVKKASAKTS